MEAFGLIVGAVQLAETLSKAYKLLRQIRSEQNVYAEAVATADILKISSAAMRDDIEHSSVLVSDRDRILLSTLQSCCDGVDDLIKHHSQYVAQQHSLSRRRAIRDTWKALWDEKLGTLERQLASREQSMQTQLLMSLRRLSHENAGTSTAIQLTVTRLEKMVADLAHERASNDRRERLLESLAFDRQFERAESIGEACEKTFEWMYATSSAACKTHLPDFPDWLVSGSGLYWIVGKPGSGKSTLMQFLTDSQRTYELLQQSTASESPLVISYFFWRHGTNYQRNLDGMLRALLWQILSVDDSVMSLGDFPTHVSSQIWNTSRLRRTLQNVLTALATRRTVCIFVDGLDESIADIASMVDLLKGLNTIQSVKVVVSVRDLEECRNLYRYDAHVKMHSKTKGDMWKVVSQRLRDEDSACQTAGLSKEQMSALRFKIVDEAEGIFLWVHCALLQVKRGISKYDSYDEIVQRLDRLPKELHDIFTHILDQIEDHRVDIVNFLRLMLMEDYRSLTPVDFACIDRPPALRQDGIGSPEELKGY
ncbi:Hypothetical protein D9617_18g034180 [Elsinoe fawcettii]|nr:Hypothetical protein D9617_18g034180 [Elsinoe fawcettii]